MSFRFSRDDKGTGAAVRRIARQEIDAALGEATAAGLSFDERVHRVRRRCKKLRGLIRLVRPRFHVYGSVNGALRDASAGLAHTRDAAVVIETLDALLKDTGAVEAETYARLRAGLAQRARHEADWTEEARLLSEFISRMRALADTVGDWRLEKREFAALEGGLTEVYGRMVKRMRLARIAPSDHNLHEWRKMAKYHGHHISLMLHAAPDLLAASRKVVYTLSDVLGDHHNLAVLIQALEVSEVQEKAREAQAVARDRQRVLATRACDLGLQLAAETPQALARRFERYWAMLRA